MFMFGQNEKRKIASFLQGANKQTKNPFNFYSHNHYKALASTGCFDVFSEETERGEIKSTENIVKINVRHVAFVFEM